MFVLHCLCAIVLLIFLLLVLQTICVSPNHCGNEYRHSIVQFGNANANAMHDWLINVGFIYLFMLLKKDDVLRIFFF